MTPTARAIRRLFPSRQPCPPRAKRLASDPTDFGRRETIEYAVEPGERVTAYLLVPHAAEGRGCPGVIASHQHNGQFDLGKSETAGLAGDPAQQIGPELCRRGMVVLCPDHLAFESRVARPDRDPRLGPLVDRNFEAFCLGDQLLRGRSLASKYLFDLCQALDVLAAHPAVNPHRLGVVGHSLGGQTALWLAFYDRRIRAAFCSCGFSTMREVQRGQIKHNYACYLPGLLSVGDINDVVAGIAPRALAMSHGTDDPIFPMSGVRRIYRAARRAFPRDRLLLMPFDGGHGLPDDVKSRGFEFLQRHLA